MLGPPYLGMMWMDGVIGFLTFVRDWALPIPAWRSDRLDLGRVVGLDLVFLLVTLIGGFTSELAVMTVQARRWHHPCLSEPSKGFTPDFVLTRLEQVVFVLSATAGLVVLRVAGWWGPA